MEPYRDGDLRLTLEKIQARQFRFLIAAYAAVILCRRKNRRNCAVHVNLYFLSRTHHRNALRSAGPRAVKRLVFP